MLALNQAAGALMSTAQRLSVASSSKGAMTAEVLDSAQDVLTSGALAVRELGGPHFARQAEGMFAAALRLDSSATRVNNAIREAMDGATALLTRATYR